MKRQPARSSTTMPAWGLIASGPLMGWRFSFIQLVRVQRRAGAVVHLDLRCTPPNWPFPTDVRFDPFKEQLSLLPGPRARRLDYAELTRIALEHGYARAALGDN